MGKLFGDVASAMIWALFLLGGVFMTFVALVVYILFWLFGYDRG